MTDDDALKMARENPEAYYGLVRDGDEPAYWAMLNTSRGGQRVYGWMQKQKDGLYTLEIPDNCMAKAVGKGGENIKRIEKRVQGKVVLIKSGEEAVRQCINFLI